MVQTCQPLGSPQEKYEAKEVHFGIIDVLLIGLIDQNVSQAVLVSWNIKDI